MTRFVAGVLLFAGAMAATAHAARGRPALFLVAGVLIVSARIVAPTSLR